MRTALPALRVRSARTAQRVLQAQQVLRVALDRAAHGVLLGLLVRLARTARRVQLALLAERR